jgi:hypothetical protein
LAIQHIEKDPGVMVEKKEDRCVSGTNEFHVVDLPGTYSLRAYSLGDVNPERQRPGGTAVKNSRCMVFKITGI